MLPILVYWTGPGWYISRDINNQRIVRQVDNPYRLPDGTDRLTLRTFATPADALVLWGAAVQIHRTDQFAGISHWLITWFSQQCEQCSELVIKNEWAWVCLQGHELAFGLYCFTCGCKKELEWRVINGGSPSPIG